MKNVLIVDADKCTGCKTCELVCSMLRDGEFNPGKSYIRILRNAELGINIPVIGVKCNFCNKCCEWCFPKAIRFVTFKEAALIRKDTKMGCFPAPLVD